MSLADDLKRLFPLMGSAGSPPGPFNPNTSGYTTNTTNASGDQWYMANQKFFKPQIVQGQVNQQQAQINMQHWAKLRADLAERMRAEAALKPMKGNGEQKKPDRIETVDLSERRYMEAGDEREEEGESR